MQKKIVVLCLTLTGTASLSSATTPVVQNTVGVDPAMGTRDFGHNSFLVPGAATAGAVGGFGAQKLLTRSVFDQVNSGISGNNLRNFGEAFSVEDGELEKVLKTVDPVHGPQHKNFARGVIPTMESFATETPKIRLLELDGTKVKPNEMQRFKVLDNIGDMADIDKKKLIEEFPNKKYIIVDGSTFPGNKIVDNVVSMTGDDLAKYTHLSDDTTKAIANASRMSKLSGGIKNGWVAALIGGIGGAILMSTTLRESKHRALRA